MSDLTASPTLAANAQAARDRLAQLETDHVTAAARVPMLQAKAHEASAALAEVERAIRNGDNHLGQVDLIERDTAKRAAGLAAEGAVHKHAQLTAQLPQARTAVLLAELEAEEHPITHGMADADAKLQAAIVSALKDWRRTAARYHAAWFAIATNVKAYDPQTVSIHDGDRLVIDGADYRDTIPASQKKWERNYNAALMVLLREDEAERAAQREAERAAQSAVDQDLVAAHGWV